MKNKIIAGIYMSSGGYAMLLGFLLGTHYRNEDWIAFGFAIFSIPFVCIVIYQLEKNL
jgi:hypothetical protein